jgi:hypothetical protein
MMVTNTHLRQISSQDDPLLQDGVIAYLDIV